MVEDANMVDGPFSEEDYRKDGSLKVAAVRRMEESVSPRGSSRSYNEVTGETTVTTVLGGSTVTFVQDGDHTDEGDIRETGDAGERSFEPGAGEGA